jgi:hypothetical protein
MAKTLRPPVAPNLPVGPVEYEQQYQNQLNNIQRLYYNTIDNTIASLMENSGGRYMNFPHLFASDSTKQYAGGDNTITPVQFDTVVRAEGFSLDTGTDAATANYSGAYKVDYRLLFENNNAAQQSVWVWLKKDGSDIAGSCSKFSVPANGYVSAAGFIELELLGGSALQLYWATDKAAVSGGATGVWMDSYASSTSPFVRPAIPSAYGAITFVSELSE